MTDDATVNAGDIARLAGVGRAAVSNWRRRHDDFPHPVGGTSSSPLFSLVEVERWLRDNGKKYAVTRGDRVWQRLRAHRDDLHLGEAVAWAGAFLLYLRRLGGDRAAWRRLARAPDLLGRLPEAVASATADLPGTLPRPLENAALIRSIADLSERRQPDGRAGGQVGGQAGGEAVDECGAAFEFLCERYVDTQSRRLSVTPADVAALMTRLACPDGGTVLDPACGLGGLLLGVRDGARLLGQELAGPAAQIAAVRLLLRGGAAADVRAGDSLRHDGFAGLRADAVVCDPPFNERAWGYDELTGDPRWEYGPPPRGESELAWVQHCLAHTRPGGTVAILMPPAAASRRPGRRIRANLLRAGALRALVTLPAGGPDLWLLRRPEPGERPPSRLLIADATGGAPLVERAWRAYSADPESDPAPASHTVRIIDLLDDEVDLSPSRHRPQRGGVDLGAAFVAARDRFARVSAALAARLPDVEPSDRSDVEPSDRPSDRSVRPRPSRPVNLPMTTVGDLVKAGLVSVHHAPVKMVTDAGETPVLTAEDVARGGPPSGRTDAEPGLIAVEPLDVVTTIITEAGAARVLAEGGAVLGPQLSLYRVDPERIDPHFLAGFLRFAGGLAPPRGHSGASRADGRRARVPLLPIGEQRAYGRAFQELVALEDTLREAAAIGDTLVRLGFDGLAAGLLRPGSAKV